MFLDIFQDMISIVCIVCVLMTCLPRLYRKSSNHHRTTLGSCIWSRRRIFWRNAGISKEAYIAHALKSRHYDNFVSIGMQKKVYYCSEPPQGREDPMCQGMGPEYSSDEAGDGPDSFEEYVTSDRKAKRRLIQRKADRKRINRKVKRSSLVVM